MMASADRLVTDLKDSLLRSVNSSGGWGYYVGRASRVEPTCWALLALLEGRPSLPDAGLLHSATAFLARAQQSSGFLVDNSRQSPNLATNGLAALLWEVRPETGSPSNVARLIQAIAREKGVVLPSSRISTQDNSIQGWPWIEGTFSWVEPTAWCLMALRRGEDTPASRVRIVDAEKLLFDRACRRGGWNYGNADMLGQDLRPYVPTTALALLALQGHRDRPSIDRGVEFLWKNRLKETSGMAYSLAMIALNVFGRKTTDVRQALMAHWERTGFLGNPQTIAMALLALTAEIHGNRAFKS